MDTAPWPQSEAAATDVAEAAEAAERLELPRPLRPTSRHAPAPSWPAAATRQESAAIGPLASGSSTHAAPAEPAAAACCTPSERDGAAGAGNVDGAAGASGADGAGAPATAAGVGKRAGGGAATALPYDWRQVTKSNRLASCVPLPRRVAASARSWKG